MHKIEELIPHSGRMSLLDEVIDYGTTYFTASVCPTSDSMFAEQQGIPAYVGIEYMGQAIAAFAGARARDSGLPVKIGLLVSARRYQASKSFFSFGDTLTVHIEEYSEEVNGLQTFSCSITGTDIEVNARLNVFMPEDATEFLESANG